MSLLPSGTVTFLFTDIEGSTKLAQAHPNEMPALLARHHEILRDAIQAQNGYVFQNEGDSLAVAFHSPPVGLALTFSGSLSIIRAKSMQILQLG